MRGIGGLLLGAYVSVNAPLKGTLIDLKSVTDKVFASGMMGDGAAIKPKEGVIYAPFSGEVIMLPKTKHAIGLRSKNGTELLIHIGMDTVEEKGNGFDALVRVGDSVKQGEPVIKFELDRLKEKYDMTTPIIVTSKECTVTQEEKAEQTVTPNDVVLICRKQ